MLKGASASRPSGVWNDDDFNVVADGVVVGRVFKAEAAPAGMPAAVTYIVPYDDGGPWGFASQRSKLYAALASMREKSDIAAGRRETEVLETSVKALSKSALVLLALAVAGTPAWSRSLHIAGTAGYLSEWEFDGEAAEARTGGELVGPLVWKHIGLCSVNGAEEKPGKIRIRLSGDTSKIDATIFFDSTRCTYSGNLSGSSGGLMDCLEAGAIPLSISIK